MTRRQQLIANQLALFLNVAEPNTQVIAAIEPELDAISIGGGRRWGHCLTLHLPPPKLAFMARYRRVEYPGTLSRLTPRGNDQQTIVPDKTDRTDFVTRLGQELLPQRWRSAKSSNDPTCAQSRIRH